MAARVLVVGLRPLAIMAPEGLVAVAAVVVVGVLMAVVAAAVFVFFFHQSAQDRQRLADIRSHIALGRSSDNLGVELMHLAAGTDVEKRIDLPTDSERTFVRFWRLIWCLPWALLTQRRR